MKHIRVLPIVTLAWLSALGCIQVRQSDDDDEGCNTNDDCASDHDCKDGECVKKGDEGGTGQGGTGGTGQGGTGGGSAQGGGGGSLASCTPPGCTENYCAMLTIWCDWDVKNKFSTKPYASCTECVQSYRDVQLPYAACRLAFLCWNTCAQQYGAQGNDAVGECIDEVCDAANVDGTGLCQQCDSDADDICAPPLTCDEGRHQCVMPG